MKQGTKVTAKLLALGSASRQLLYLALLFTAGVGALRLRLGRLRLLPRRAFQLLAFYFIFNLLCICHSFLSNNDLATAKASRTLERHSVYQPWAGITKSAQ